MRKGIVVLVAAYGLSQFYRAFLAVLSPALAADLGTTPDDLAFASGIWFLIFAAMQIPVGAALDTVGPGRTAAFVFAMGGAGGAAVFAMAQSPAHITFAMALIGIGCSPVLMASYYIFARVFPAAVFGTLAGATIGFGSLGNIAGSAPMAWAVATFGWRETMWGLAALTLALAALILAVVKDPPRVVSAARGSVLDILRMPALWPILALMFVNYAPAAGIRGLWAGPYAADVLGADQGRIGLITLVMGLSMIAGSFAYGPLERFFRTRKWVIFWGNLGGVLGCLALWAVPDPGTVAATALLAVIGFCGASFPMLVAHARAFFPAHLTGRGVTLVNLFGIGGVGLAQVATGPLFDWASARHDPAGAYGVLFGFFAVILALGLVVYLGSRDRTD